MLVLTSAALLLTSCYVEDPGPIQYTERQFSIVDFDRVEMGEEFHVQIGDFFQVSAAGDRRNIEDLIVEKEGNTLVIRYCTFRERRHETDITVTMPELYAVNFSCASESRVSGFRGMDRFDVYLSGASVCQLDVESSHVSAVLSGASYLNLRGTGEELEADISGSSAFKAFGFPVLRADLVFSGASDGKVTVSDHLDVVATGASHLVYRGEPTVVSEISDSSSIHHD
jgi:hypothetical protein